jgi:hypothetical protein
MEPNFVSVKCKSWVKNTVTYCPQKSLAKNVFFCHDWLLHFLEHVLFYTVFISTAFYVVYFVSKKGSVERIFITSFKIIGRLKHEHNDTYDKTFFYIIYRIYFSHYYRIEKSTVKVYISPFLFIVVYDNAKQTIVQGQSRKGTTFVCELYGHITEKNYAVCLL